MVCEHADVFVCLSCTDAVICSNNPAFGGLGGWKHTGRGCFLCACSWHHVVFWRQHHRAGTGSQPAALMPFPLTCRLQMTTLRPPTLTTARSACGGISSSGCASSATPSALTAGASTMSRCVGGSCLAMRCLPGNCCRAKTNQCGVVGIETCPPPLLPPRPAPGQGYDGKFVMEYVNATVPLMAFGEFWDTCSYTGGRTHHYVLPLDE